MGRGNALPNKTSMFSLLSDFRSSGSKKHYGNLLQNCFHTIVPAELAGLAVISGVNSGIRNDCLPLYQMLSYGIIRIFWATSPPPHTFTALTSWLAHKDEQSHKRGLPYVLPYHLACAFHCKDSTLLVNP